MTTLDLTVLVRKVRKIVKLIIRVKKTFPERSIFDQLIRLSRTDFKPNNYSKKKVANTNDDILIKTQFLILSF